MQPPAWRFTPLQLRCSFLCNFFCCVNPLSSMQRATITQKWTKISCQKLSKWFNLGKKTLFNEEMETDQCPNSKGTSILFMIGRNNQQHAATESVLQSKCTRQVKMAKPAQNIPLQWWQFKCWHVCKVEQVEASPCTSDPFKGKLKIESSRWVQWPTNWCTFSKGCFANWDAVNLPCLGRSTMQLAPMPFSPFFQIDLLFLCARTKRNRRCSRCQAVEIFSRADGVCHFSLRWGTFSQIMGENKHVIINITSFDKLCEQKRWERSHPQKNNMVQSCITEGKLLKKIIAFFWFSTTLPLWLRLNLTLPGQVIWLH